MKNSFKVVGIALGFAALPLFAMADSVSVNFENPPYSLGTINAQDGWTSTGAAGSGCAVYDHAVASSLAVSGFGSQSLRVSNAVTSGCFGDQTFSKSLVNAVGETGAGAGAYPIGTLQNHFEAEFDVASTMPGSQQPGLFMSVSPDRGDGSRMSYLGFSDEPAGIVINFYDVQGTSNPANFVSTTLGTFARNTTHHIKLVFDAVNGASNDVVKVYIDGNLLHTGTSWENYYRFDSESSAEQNVRAVRNVLFRSGGTAFPANAGKGYLVDNLSITSGPSTPASMTTTVVRPADLATSFADVVSDSAKWFFYNDENDTIDTTLGTMVTGPATPPLGTGSSRIGVTGTQRRNLATYQFSGTKLADITTLKFSTYNPSAGNGGSANRSAYLNFNVDFNGSDTWQRRLVFVPNQNGTVTQNNWKEWDALQGGSAKWSYSGATWPVAAVGPHAGQTGVSGTTLRTWSEILADYPNIRIRVTDSWLGMRVGEPYADGYTENLDKFVFGTATAVKTFDFEPTLVASTVNVTVKKYVDGVQATAANANSSSFNMVSVQSATPGPLAGNIFSLAPASYEAVSAPIPSGGVYAAVEFTGDAIVGATCAAGRPFALVGYTTGDTLAEAQAATPTSTMPVFINMTGDKYVIVWNQKCAAPSTTGTLVVTKVANGGNGTFNFSSTKSGYDAGYGAFGSFSITTSGGSGSKTITNIAPGTYSVAESVPSGWTLTSNGCSSIAITANATTTCTMVNTYAPVPDPACNAYTAEGCPSPTGNLQIMKSANGGNGTFNFSSSLGSFSITTSGGSGSHLYSGVPTGYYTVTETVPAGWALNSNGCQSVYVSANQTTSCTITNTMQAIPTTGALQVTKMTNGGNGTFNFSSTKSGYDAGYGAFGSFSITTSGGTGSATFGGLTPGVYSVSESTPSGWTQNSNTCSSVTVTAGQTAQCTVTNTKNPAPAGCEAGVQDPSCTQ